MSSNASAARSVIDDHDAGRSPAAVLQLPPGASEKEIHTAFRELSKRVHPDKNDAGDVRFKLAFQYVNEAHAKLTKKEAATPGAPRHYEAEDVASMMEEIKRTAAATCPARYARCAPIVRPDPRPRPSPWFPTKVPAAKRRRTASASARKKRKTAPTAAAPARMIDEELAAAGV